jgi:hypothetical protein
MNRIIWISALLFFLVSGINSQQAYKGYLNFEYDTSTGKIQLQVPDNFIGQEFLYVNSLSAGIGSNDIGMDRGQLGKDRIVKFIKTGNKLMLLEPNYKYRAISKNPLEVKAMEEAFVQSILFGFEIIKTANQTHYIDFTPFLIRDSHGIGERLKNSKQGSYKVDMSRSAIWTDRTKSFPDNSEFEALLTFEGDYKAGPRGEWIKSVSPDEDAVSVRVHHSFIRLPDQNYTPREFHPYSGYGMVSFYDYAVPIESTLEKKYIRRHRLKKKNPGADVSEAVEPIIYYIDPGCPEPIKSALMEGASWWDQAYQSAGYAPNTFQVKELPEGADMLDVRYNVIQWIHRSTRGWSYGSSVVDPRTGEIIKGHVSLGSLRVRQDFLIAQGILSPYGIMENPDDQMKEMALARLRQLGAHEVGHTLGLSHNFASSVNSRASVMDYPHPVFQLTEEGIFVDEVYDNKIGNWDKKTIQYGYSDFQTGVDEKAELLKMISETQDEGYLYMSDQDARPIGGAHALAHLWDSGNDPVTEMERLLALRKNALSRFGISSIADQTPLSELEKVLVPLYLMHRYQAEAVVKMIGGLNYHYNLKGDAYPDEVQLIAPEKQGTAVDVLLKSLRPENLELPGSILKLIHPPAMGFGRDRETFDGRTNLTFDPLAPAESYTNSLLNMLLDKDRLARIHRQNTAMGSPIELDGFLSMLSAEIFEMTGQGVGHDALVKLVQRNLVFRLSELAFGNKIDPVVASSCYGVLKDLEKTYLSEPVKSNRYQALYLKRLIESGESGKSQFILPEMKSLPPGSPIGCGNFH